MELGKSKSELSNQSTKLEKIDLIKNERRQMTSSSLGENDDRLPRRALQWDRIGNNKAKTWRIKEKLEQCASRLKSHGLT